VQELLSQGLAEWPPLHSVGYNEVCQFLRGEIPKEDLAEAIAAANIRLIKKQLTWFKRDKDIRWFTVDKLATAKEYVLAQLNY
jgi:tRNA dimethylallyltransferase